LIAESAENGLDSVKDFFVAADHDFMNAAACARLTGGDGRIEHESAFSAIERFEAADERRRACGDINVNRSGSYTLQNSICAAGDLLDIVGHRQCGDNDVTSARQFTRRIYDLRPVLSKRADRLFPKIEHDHRETRALDMAGDRTAHIAETDETDCLHGFSCLPQMIPNIAERLCWCQRAGFAL
jgi:hypothetical protein